MRHKDLEVDAQYHQNLHFEDLKSTKKFFIKFK